MDKFRTDYGYGADPTDPTHDQNPPPQAYKIKDETGQTHTVYGPPGASFEDVVEAHLHFREQKLNDQVAMQGEVSEAHARREADKEATGGWGNFAYDTGMGFAQNLPFVGEGIPEVGAKIESNLTGEPYEDTYRDWRADRIASDEAMEDIVEERNDTWYGQLLPDGMPQTARAGAKFAGAMTGGGLLKGLGVAGSAVAGGVGAGMDAFLSNEGNSFERMEGVPEATVIGAVGGAAMKGLTNKLAGKSKLGIGAKGDHNWQSALAHADDLYEGAKQSKITLDTTFAEKMSAALYRSGSKVAKTKPGFLMTDDSGPGAAPIANKILNDLLQSPGQNGFVSAGGTYNNLNSQQVVNLIRQIRGAADDLSGNEARVLREAAGLIKKGLKEYAAKIPGKRGGEMKRFLEMFDDADKFWRQGKQAQLLDETITNARTQAGSNAPGHSEANAVAKSVKSLVNSPRGKQFDETAQGAMRDIATHSTGVTERGARHMGVFDPSSSHLRGMLTLGGMASGDSGTQTAAIAAAVLGNRAGKLAEGWTEKAVAKLQQGVANGTLTREWTSLQKALGRGGGGAKSSAMINLLSRTLGSKLGVDPEAVGEAALNTVIHGPFGESE